MMLDDPTLADKVTSKIQEGIIVEQAVADATQELAAMLASMQMSTSPPARPMSRMLGGACCASCSVCRIPLSATCKSLDHYRSRPDPLRYRQAGSRPGAGILHRLRRFDLAQRHPGPHPGTARPSLALGSRATVETIKTGDPLLMDGATGALILAPDEATITRYRKTQAGKGIPAADHQSQRPKRSPHCGRAAGGSGCQYR